LILWIDPFALLRSAGEVLHPEAGELLRDR
jgi:hypothetical protein